MPVIRHKSVEYVGMFEYKKEDEELLIRSLIFGECSARGRVAIREFCTLLCYDVIRVGDRICASFVLVSLCFFIPV